MKQFIPPVLRNNYYLAQFFKALTQGLTAEEIDQFRFGNSSAGTACTNNGNTAIPMATLNNEGLLDVNSLAFPPKFQIAANQLEICKFLSHLISRVDSYRRNFLNANDVDRNDLLGEGEFAFCFRGKFNGTEVAVKMPKSSVQTEDFKNYLKEVKLMACIGQHPNIIGFYGAVIEKLDQSEPPEKFTDFRTLIIIINVMGFTQKWHQS